MIYNIFSLFLFQAKRLFHQVCPDEEFLPTPPNPEDIIHVDDEESPVVTGNSPEFESGTDNPEGKGEEGSESSKASDQENQESPMTASSTVEMDSKVENANGKQKEVDTCETSGQNRH